MSAARAVVVGLCVAALVAVGPAAARAQQTVEPSLGSTASGATASGTTASGATDPWLEGAFVADAGRLLAAADALAPVTVTPEAPTVVLFEDVSYRFGADGRTVYRRHWVYRILDAAAFADWGVVQARWSPWAQEPPTLRARVVDAAGTEHVLDPARLGVGRAPEGDDSLGDRRLVQARLVGLGVGSVVEEMVEIRDHRAGFAAGLFARHYLVKRVPVRHARLTLTASTRVPLRYGVRKLPGLEPRRTVGGGSEGDDTVRLVFEARDLAAAPEVEEGVPAHRPLYPHVAFSTGWSWAHVAAAEAVRFDAVLAGARLPGLPTAADLGGRSTRDKARAVVAAVRAAVAFDGLEVLASEPIPSPPDVTLARGRGDSLDLAAVVVAGLRRVGVPAQLAWIHAGFGRDVEPRLPGLGGFQHALVCFDDGDETVWIDPSHPFAAVGELPLRDQGRFALRVAAGDAAPEELERTPTSSPEDNLALEQRQIDMADYGPGRLVETSIYRGSAARTQRGVTAGLSAEERRRGYRSYAQAFHRAGDVGALDESSPFALDEPFRLRLEILDSERVRTELERAVVEVPVAEIARRLPSLFFAPPAPRREEFVFHEPFVNRWVYRVTPPPGFRAVAPEPAEETVALGPGRYRQSVALDETGALIAEIELDVGQRLLSPAQLETMVASVQELLGRPPLELRLVTDMVDADDGPAVAQALRALLDAVRAAPDRAVRRLRLARGLLRVGQVDEARRQAELAVELAPAWAPAHATLADARVHGVGGVWSGPGADLAGARASLREAVRLAPEDEAYRLELARALLAEIEIGSVGAVAGDPEQIDEALEILRAARRDLGSAAAAVAEARLLLRLERDAEAASVAAVADDPALEQAARIALAVSARDRSARDEPRSDEPRSDEPRSDEPGSADIARADVLRELLSLRRYAAAVRRAPAAQRALLVATRRHETLDGLADDPSTPVRGLLADVLRRGASRAELSRWLHPRLLAAVDQGGLEPLRRMLVPLADAVAAPLEAAVGAPLPPLTRIDLALSALELDLDGAPHLGYRVAPRVEEVEPSGRLFLTLLGEVPTVVASSAAPGALGLEAQARLQQGDLPGARQWLAWAAEELEAQATAAPEAATGGDTFLGAWRAADDETTAAARPLRVLAALLAWPLDRSGQAAAALRAEESRLAALPPAVVDEAPWSHADMTVVARRAEAVLAGPSTAAEIETASPTASAARALRALLTVPAGARAPADELLARAEEALADGGLRDPELLRAAAAVVAAAGRPLRARALLEEAIVRADPAAPSAGDWVVVGKIAEAIDLHLLADAAYARVPSIDPASADSWSAVIAVSGSALN